MAYKGAQHFDLDLLTQSPAPELDQSKSGGFKDPLIGTVIVVLMSTLIALPLGIVDRDLADRVRAARLAGAAGRVGDRDRSPAPRASSSRSSA